MKTQQQIEFHAFKAGYDLALSPKTLPLSPKSSGDGFLEIKFEEYMQQTFQLELDFD
jgi:hypothetical protein